MKHNYIEFIDLSIQMWIPARSSIMIYHSMSNARYWHLLHTKHLVLIFPIFYNFQDACISKLRRGTLYVSIYRILYVSILWYICMKYAWYLLAAIFGIEWYNWGIWWNSYLNTQINKLCVIMFCTILIDSETAFNYSR